MLIQEKADRMHQNVAQQAVAQMPEIPRPDPFHLAAIGQLPKDGVDKVTNAPQHGTLVRRRFRRMRFAERRLQDQAFRAQGSLQIGKPIIAISQHDPGRAFQQEGRDFSIGFIGGSQEDTSE